MYEEEISKCEKILENIEKFGYVKNDFDFVKSLNDETWEIIQSKDYKSKDINDDVMKAYLISATLCNMATKCFIPYYDISQDIYEAKYEGQLTRKGCNTLSGIKMIDVVKKINAIFCIENPTKAPNKVAFGWNYAFTKEHPIGYLLACIRNYLKENNAEFTEDEIKMIVGLKKDPFYKGVLY